MMININKQSAVLDYFLSNKSEFYYVDVLIIDLEQLLVYRPQLVLKNNINFYKLLNIYDEILKDAVVSNIVDSVILTSYLDAITTLDLNDDPAKINKAVLSKVSDVLTTQYKITAYVGDDADIGCLDVYLKSLINSYYALTHVYTKHTTKYIEGYDLYLDQPFDFYVPHAIDCNLNTHYSYLCCHIKFYRKKDM